MVKSRFNLLKVIIAICVLSLSISLASVFVGKNQKTVSADAPVADNGIAMVTGVSVKLSASGLRYRALIGDTLWASVKDDANLQVGILVFPTQYITNDASIIGNYHAAIANQTAGGSAYGTFQAQDISVVKAKVYRTAYAGGIYYCANGVLQSIQSNHLDLAYTSVGYVKNVSAGTYTYADANSAKSLYKAVNALWLYPDAEDRAIYRSELSTTYSLDSWYGTASYPILVDTSTNFDEYDIIVNDIKAGNTYSGKYIKLSTDQVRAAGSDVIGLNGSYAFQGNFTADSAVVRAYAASDVVEDFDYAQSVTRFKGGVSTADFTRATSTWLPTYNGENGVVKVQYDNTLTSAWPWLMFLPANDVTSYNSYSYIYVRMYVENKANQKEFYYFDMGADDYNNNANNRWALNYNPQVPGNQWVDYYFEIHPFLTLWNQAVSGNYGKARLWMKSSTDVGGVIYVSEIKVTDTYNRPAAREDEINDCSPIDYETSLQATGSTRVRYRLDDVPTGCETTKGYPQFTIPENSGWLNVKVTPRQALENYYHYSCIKVTLRINVAVGSQSTYPTVALQFWGNFIDVKNVYVNVWQTVYLKFEDFYQYYSEMGVGQSQYLFYIDNRAGGAYNGKITGVALYEVTACDDPYGETGKYSSINANRTSAFRTLAGGTATFVSTPLSGVSNYMSITGDTDVNYFNLCIGANGSFYDLTQSDYVRFKVYIPGSGSVPVSVANFPVTTISKGSWQTFDMPLGLYASTRHASYKWTSLMDMYLANKREKVLCFSGSNIDTMYVADISYGTAQTDATLGNKALHISQGNLFSSAAGATLSFSNGELTVTSSTTYTNIYAKFGKTFKELYNSNYTRLNFEVTYTTGTPGSLKIYMMGRLWGAVDNNYQVGCEPNDGWFNKGSNKVVLYKNISDVLALYESINQGFIRNADGLFSPFFVIMASSATPYTLKISNIYFS